MLTETEKTAIGIIVSDIASGRHLLRTKKQWDNFEKNYGITVEDYDNVYKVIHKISKYSMIAETDLTVKDYEIFIYYKKHQDYNFNQAILSL